MREMTKDGYSTGGDGIVDSPVSKASISRNHDTLFSPGRVEDDFIGLRAEISFVHVDGIMAGLAKSIRDNLRKIFVNEEAQGLRLCGGKFEPGDFLAGETDAGKNVLSRQVVLLRDLVDAHAAGELIEHDAHRNSSAEDYRHAALYCRIDADFFEDLFHIGIVVQ